MPKKKVNHLQPPKPECNYCSGTGEVRDHSRLFGGMKKCALCKGEGKFTSTCIDCKELLTEHKSGKWCSNRNCKRFGLLSIVHLA